MPVADRLVERLDQTGEDARVEVDPASAASPADRDDCGVQDAGVRDDRSGRARRRCAAGGRRMSRCELVADDVAVRRERRLVALEPRREAAAEVDQPRLDAARLEAGEDLAGGDDRARARPPGRAAASRRGRRRRPR